MNKLHITLERFDPEMPHETICLSIEIENRVVPDIIVYEGPNQTFHGCYELSPYMEPEKDHYTYTLVDHHKVV